MTSIELDPRILSSLEDPYPLFRELREKHPIAFSEARNMWVVSRYADVRAMLSDAETFSSSHGTIPTGFVPEKPMMFSQDPPYHTHLRSAVHASFTPRRVRALETFTRRAARELLDAIDPSEEVDLVSAFSDPLPIVILTELLGIGIGDRDAFKRRADVIIHAATKGAEEVDEAQQWVYDYVEGVLPEREKNPGEDLLSHLLHPADGTPTLKRDELLGFCALLLLGGSEATANGFNNAIYLLHSQPALRRQLTDDPSQLDSAVEESLRLEAPVSGLSRVVTKDIELLGQKIERGSRIHMLYASANRDEAIFPEPDSFRLGRYPNPHLTFGLGVHFCLGAALARMELRIGLQELLARFPSYELIPERWERLVSDTGRGFVRQPARLNVH